jgi:hypothetical protein
MEWLTRLPNFVGSLFVHWVALLTGGTGVLVLAFWERRLRPITFPQYVALAITAIIPAAYLSWLDEHELRAKAEAQIASFNNSVAEQSAICR